MPEVAVLKRRAVRFVGDVVFDPPIKEGTTGELTGKQGVYIDPDGKFSFGLEVFVRSSSSFTGHAYVPAEKLVLLP